MYEYPNIALLGIRDLDADQTGLSTVSEAPHVKSETSAYPYLAIAGLTAPMLINVVILLCIQLITLRTRDAVMGESASNDEVWCRCPRHVS